MKEELETKRCQLELEIDRFKRENAAISKLRLEREEVSDMCSNITYVYSNEIQNLRKLREEISDFQKQRAEEMEQFEEYKREEIKKLKYLIIIVIITHGYVNGILEKNEKCLKHIKNNYFQSQIEENDKKQKH